MPRTITHKHSKRKRFERYRQRLREGYLSPSAPPSAGFLRLLKDNLQCKSKSFAHMFISPGELSLGGENERDKYLFRSATSVIARELNLPLLCASVECGAGKWFRGARSRRITFGSVPAPSETALNATTTVSGAPTTEGNPVSPDNSIVPIEEAGDGIKRKRGVRLPMKQRKKTATPKDEGAKSKKTPGESGDAGQAPQGGVKKGKKSSAKKKSKSKDSLPKGTLSESALPDIPVTAPPGSGPLFAAISRYPLLTPSQEKELAERIQRDGDREAFELFVMSNLRLAMACVRDVMRRMGGNTILDLADLAQEAVLGLMTAVRRFDPDRGVRFSTYGLYWIYQRVKRAIVSQRRGITVPGFAGESVFAMTEYIELYNQGKENKIPKRYRNRVRDLSRITSTVMSFGDADMDESTGMQKGGTVDESRFMDPDKNSSNYFLGEETMSRFFKSDFHALLDQELTPYEADILRRKFGLSPYAVPANYKEIGEAHGRSSETVRLSMEAALKKLKKNKRVEEFMEAWLKKD